VAYSSDPIENQSDCIAANPPEDCYYTLTIEGIDQPSYFLTGEAKQIMFSLDYNDEYLDGYCAVEYFDDIDPVSLSSVTSLITDTIQMDNPYSRYYTPMLFSFLTET